jgi:hypothetical protein
VSQTDTLTSPAVTLWRPSVGILIPGMSLGVQCWGAGQAGAGALPFEQYAGAGGSYAAATYVVTSGDVAAGGVAIAIGTGGAGVVASTTGAPGGDTSFGASAVVAPGGGSATVAVGAVTYPGGSGGTAGTEAGSGAAGPHGAGNNSNYTQTGGSGDAGYGGAGGTSGNPGQSSPTGGGGGGGSSVGRAGSGGAPGGGGGNGWSTILPGSGANGQIVVTYTPVPLSKPRRIIAFLRHPYRGPLCRVHTWRKVLPANRPRWVSMPRDVRWVAMPIDGVTMSSPSLLPDAVPVGAMGVTDTSEQIGLDFTAAMAARNDTIASVGVPIIQRDDGAALTSADVLVTGQQVISAGLQVVLAVTARGNAALYQIGVPLTLASGTAITRWIALRTLSVLG